MERAKLDKLLAMFVRLRPRLVAVAQARTGSRTAAEDLLQDAWLKLESSDFSGVVNNPGGFISSIAERTVLDHLRKERRRAEIDAEVLQLLWNESDEVSPERTMMGRETLQAVLDALADMPEKTRRIFLMNRIEGIAHRRIAEMLGVSDEAVYYHIRRALEQLARLRDTLAG